MLLEHFSYLISMTLFCQNYHADEDTLLTMGTTPDIDGLRFFLWAISIRVNSPENAQLTFNNVVNDQMQEMVETNFKFYKQVNDDPDFAQALLSWLFQRYLDRANERTNDGAESA